MKKLLALSVCIGAITIAHAESIDEKQYWKGQMNYLDRSIKDAEKDCGTTFTSEWVDRPKFRAETEKTRHEPYTICRDIVNRVRMLCRDGDDEKATVKAKIKGFQCGFSNPRALKLDGGKLVYMGNHVESNFDYWAKPWLLKNL